MIELETRHWEHENHKQRMLTKDWRELLLAHKDTVVFHGLVRQLKSRSLGAGVLEIYKEPLDDSTKI